MFNLHPILVRRARAPGRVLGAHRRRVASRRAAETALAFHILEFIRKRSTARSRCSRNAQRFSYTISIPLISDFFQRFRLVISSLDGGAVVMRQPGY